MKVKEALELLPPKIRSVLLMRIKSGHIDTDFIRTFILKEVVSSDDFDDDEEEEEYRKKNIGDVMELNLANPSELLTMFFWEEQEEECLLEKWCWKIKEKLDNN